MRQNDVPTIGKNYSISKKDEERMIWNTMSKLWDGYADIVSKIYGDDEYLHESNEARKKAAYYAKRLIDSMESEGKE